ncbi:YigZ family protein [Cupriavidus sp. IK-TO18]|nr:YigZ family protein [Cupriavidus sp. IK-TO18]
MGATAGVPHPLRYTSRFCPRPHRAASSSFFRPSRLPTYTLAHPVQAEVEIRKSRFLALALPVADRDAAMAALQALRAEHPTATHVCWALLAGGASGMSDDGEPSGTAGRPILEVLRHHDLDGVLAAVVRYYGGVKLGAGGLVRAYTDAIAAALKSAERIERIAYATLTISIDYADEPRVRRWIEQAAQHGCTLADTAYGALATLVLRLPATQVDTARDALRDATHGRAQFPQAQDDSHG